MLLAAMDMFPTRSLVAPSIADAFPVLPGRRCHGHPTNKTAKVRKAVQRTIAGINYGV